MKAPGLFRGSSVCGVLVLIMVLGSGLVTIGATPKSLTYGSAERIATLDPQMSLDITVFAVSQHIFDPLVIRDETGTIQPCLAESWEMVDPCTWRFRLRRGVRFHDGTPLTAECVKYTLDRLVNPSTKSPQAVLWADLKDVQVVDESTVVVRTTRPIGPLLYNLALVPILPVGADTKPGFSQKPVGTGPFKVVRWSKGDRLVLEANRDYWRGSPKIDRLEWREIPEAATRVSALESGEVDVVNNVPPEEVPRLKQNPHVTLMSTPSYRSVFLWMNCGRAPFDNPKVRDAVRYAVDPEPIVNHVLGGSARRARGPLAPGIFGACELEPYSYDVERAKKLLVEAGYPTGFEVTLKFAEMDVKMKEVAEAIAHQLGKVGIRVNLVQQDVAVWTSDLLALRWDMVTAGGTCLTGDADFILRRLYHSSAKRTGYVNSELDRLLEDGQTNVDQNARAQAYARAQKLLWDDGPAVWLFEYVATYAADTKVRGFRPRPDDMVNFYKVSLED